MKKILENGIVIHSFDLPDTKSVTVLLSLYGGAAWEKRSQKGITHLVEHLCLRRVAGKKQSDIYYDIESVGGILRAVTYRDRVVFEITLPKEHLLRALSFLRDMFEDNGWTNEDIRREKAVVCREIASSGDWCYKRMIYNFFDEQPQGDYICGTESKVKRFSKNDLVKWKDRLFCTEGTEIVVAGVKTDIPEKLFGDLETKKQTFCEDISPKYFLCREECDDRIYTYDSNRLWVVLNFDIPKEYIKCARLLKDTLCGNLYSPFLLTLREELGLIYEVFADVQEYTFGGLMYFMFEVDSDKVKHFTEQLATIIAQEKNCLCKKSFECAYAYMNDGYKSLSDMAYSVFCNSMELTYEEVAGSAKTIFKPENMRVMFYDVPEDTADSLKGMSKILRNKLEKDI